ncbi:MAG: hypothetical protein ACPGJS_18320 [Flammeovirgaceae bacterium]
MKIIAQQKTNRFKLLLALYIACDADCDFSINMEQLAEQRQIPYKRFLKAFRYLVDENFIQRAEGGGEAQASITHKGIKVLEEVFLDSQKQTYYFPPYREMRKQD